MRTISQIATMLNTSYNVVNKAMEYQNIKPTIINKKKHLDIYQEDLIIQQLYFENRLNEIVLNSKINSNFV